MKATTLNKYSKNALPTLQRKAVSIFNEYIRLRDQDRKTGVFRCISCGHVKAAEGMHAGHYMSAGLHSATRFHEDNVHGQCVRCNTFFSGNLKEYRERLIKKIGIAKVEEIEVRAKMKVKIDRYTLVDVIETYTEKIKSIKCSSDT